MGIMIRAIRIFKADVHGVMDQLQNEGLLLKQYLRDMAEMLNLKEVKLNKLLVIRKQAQQEYDKYQQQSKSLEQDLAVAIQKDRKDIARILIRKIKPMENRHAEFAERIRHLDEEYSCGRDQLDQQRIRYDRLKHRSIEFFHNAPTQELQRIPAETGTADNYGELSEDEIELELLKRQETLNKYWGDT
jgi:phage shock protein A